MIFLVKVERDTGDITVSAIDDEGATVAGNFSETATAEDLLVTAAPANEPSGEWSSAPNAPRRFGVRPHQPELVGANKMIALVNGRSDRGPPARSQCPKR
jgi:hypothetical protein